MRVSSETGRKIFKCIFGRHDLYKATGKPLNICINGFFAITTTSRNIESICQGIIYLTEYRPIFSTCGVVLTVNEEAIW